MELHKEIAFIRNLLLLLVGIAGLMILKNLSGILLPLVLALLLSVIYLPVVLYLEGKRIPRKLIVTFIAVLTLGLVYTVANIFITTINEIISQSEFLLGQLTGKFILLAESVARIPYLDLEPDMETVQRILNQVLNPDVITAAASSILKGAGSFGSSFLMFTLYFLFLLPGLSHYKSYLQYVGGRNVSILDDYEIMQNNISTYMGIKTIISLCTGTIAGLVCWMLGLKFPFFWGFMSFVLNFIPSIGSIIATLLPTLMGLVQFETFKEVFFLMMLLGVNQMLIGNVIDPRIMGNRLRLNTVTVLFGLVFWGVIWGVPGMLMSVPLMVTLKLILEKSETWSIIARIMGYPEKQSRPAGPKRGRRKPRQKDGNGTD